MEPPLVRGDARHLPFGDTTFDIIVGSPPWDKPRLLRKCNKEFRRVIKPTGQMIFINRGTTDVYDAGYLLLGQLPTPLHTTRGFKYRSTPEWFVRWILGQLPKGRLLDPFAGLDTIPRIARAMNFVAVGVEIDKETVYRHQSITESTNGEHKELVANAR